MSPDEFFFICWNAAKLPDGHGWNDAFKQRRRVLFEVGPYRGVIEGNHDYHMLAPEDRRLMVLLGLENGNLYVEALFDGELKTRWAADPSHVDETKLRLYGDPTVRYFLLDIEEEICRILASEIDKEILTTLRRCE